MTGKQFKIKLIELDLTHTQAAKLLNISLKTITNICASSTVKKVYEYAILWLECSKEKEQ